MTGQEGSPQQAVQYSESFLAALMGASYAEPIEGLYARLEEGILLATRLRNIAPVSPGWGVLRVPLEETPAFIEGRLIQLTKDLWNVAPVAGVSSSVAERYWGRVIEDEVTFRSEQAA